MVTDDGRAVVKDWNTYLVEGEDRKVVRCGHYRRCLFWWRFVPGERDALYWLKVVDVGANLMMLAGLIVVVSGWIWLFLAARTP